MDITLQLSLPKDLVTLLGPSQAQAAEAVKEYAILGLFQEGCISAGKAAELLGLLPRGFVSLLDRKSIDYFRFDVQAWADEVAAVQK